MFTFHSSSGTCWKTTLGIVLFSSTILYFSCNKHPVAPGGQLAENENTPQKMLPEKIVSGPNSITFSYQDQSALITEITHSSGDQQKLSYTEKGRLSFLQKLRSNVVYEYLSYATDSRDLITTARRYVINGSTYTVTETLKFSYDSQDRLQVVERYTKSNELISRDERVYNTSGNLAEMRGRTAGGQESIRQYSFDNKQGCFKNVPDIDFIAMESDLELMYNQNNNRLTSISNNILNSSYSCQYNENGYPTMITENGNTASAFRITYT